MLSSEQEDALARIIGGRRPVFVTGVAGTGKSTLLRELVKRTGWPVCASTGVAAVNIGGVTLHSYLGVGLANLSGEALVSKIMKFGRYKWLTPAIIIDEISMVDGDLLDKLDYVGQRVRGENRPFGGIRLIMFGDFLQLPPVGKERYGGDPAKYAFESNYWNTANVEKIELTKVYRQSDEVFVDILSRIRRGERVIDYELVSCNAKRSSIDTLKLRPTNAKVDEINSSRFSELPGQIITYSAIDSGDTKRLADLNIPAVLYLKPGAKVMLLYNVDVSRGLCNGSVGKITHIDAATIKAKFGEAEIDVVRQRIDICVGYEVIASRLQFPLRLAYAVTIHKSQGLSLTEADLNLFGCFSAGHVYVALSRLRSLEGLFLTGYDPDKIKADPKALEFHVRN
jgi:ATP-dependent DNA helicase PIF1